MAFNPDQFLNTEVLGATATEYIPIPQGEWLAICDDVKIRTVNLNDGGTGYSFTTSWEIIDEECKKEMDVERNPKCRFDFFLDLDANGGLKNGKGENVKLGRLREALGMNDPSTPFVPAMVKGQTARVKTGYRMSGGEQYTEVKDIAAAA